MGEWIWPVIAFTLVGALIAGALVAGARGRPDLPEWGGDGGSRNHLFLFGYLASTRDRRRRRRR